MNAKTILIKYFHPSGRGLPNGSHYQKGGFLAECRRNANAFILSEAVFGTQSSMSKKYGGVLVLPVTVSAANEENEVFVNSIKQLIEGQKEHIKAYSVGNFFKGKYVSVSGYVYDETSICIAVNIVSCKALYALAKTTAHRFNTDEVLVKNLNNSSYVLCRP